MPDQLARERSTTLVFYGCILLLGYLIYLLFEPFLAPLAWAAIFAAFFFPRYKRLEARFGKTTAASICTVAVTLIIVVPFVLIAIAFIQQASQTIGQIDIAANSSKGLARVQRAWMWAQRQRLGQNLGSFEDFLKTATAWLAGVGGHRRRRPGEKPRGRGRRSGDHAVRAVFLFQGRRCPHESRAARAAVRAVLSRPAHRGGVGTCPRQRQRGPGRGDCAGRRRGYRVCLTRASGRRFSGAS